MIAEMMPIQTSWKSEQFSAEISMIEKDENKALAISLIEKLPDYFFHVAASSTGKYHPSYTQGDGGLVRHTKAAVRIAIDLMRLEMYSFLKPRHDDIIIALILHDGWKHGPQTEDGSYAEYSDQSHSRICAEWLHSLAKEYPNQGPMLYSIADLVLTHMGQWNVNSRTGERFAPVPQTQEQCFVHICDYLASRKAIEYNFDASFGV